MAQSESVVTFRGLREKSTTRRILSGETLALAYGKEVIADIVPRKPKLKHRPTMDEIMAPIHAAAEDLRRRGVKPGRDLILEDRERFRR